MELFTDDACCGLGCVAVAEVALELLIMVLPDRGLTVAPPLSDRNDATFASLAVPVSGRSEGPNLVLRFVLTRFLGPESNGIGGKVAIDLAFSSWYNNSA